MDLASSLSRTNKETREIWRLDLRAAAAAGLRLGCCSRLKRKIGKEDLTRKHCQFHHWTWIYHGENVSVRYLYNIQPTRSSPTQQLWYSCCIANAKSTSCGKMMSTFLHPGVTQPLSGLRRCKCWMRRWELCRLMPLGLLAMAPDLRLCRQHQEPVSAGMWEHLLCIYLYVDVNVNSILRVLLRVLYIYSLIIRMINTFVTCLKSMIDTVHMYWSVSFWLHPPETHPQKSGFHAAQPASFSSFSSFSSFLTDSKLCDLA